MLAPTVKIRVLRDATAGLDSLNAPFSVERVDAQREIAAWRLAVPFVQIAESARRNAKIVGESLQAVTRVHESLNAPLPSDHAAETTVSRRLCQRFTVTEYRDNPSMEETFGERVRRLRGELGVSQAELARLSGLSPGTIGDIEQGMQQGTRKIDLLAKALQTTPEYLRYGRGPAHPHRSNLVSADETLPPAALQVARAWMDADPVTQDNICTLLKVELKTWMPTPETVRREKRSYIKGTK